VQTQSTIEGVDKYKNIELYGAIESTIATIEPLKGAIGNTV